MPEINQSRRSFVKLAGVAGITGVAGCSSDETQATTTTNSDGETQLTWTTTSQGSAGYQGATGMASIVNENSDNIYMEAQTSDGTSANIGKLQRGEAQVAYQQNFTTQQVYRQIEPYAEINFTPNQLKHFLNTDWLFVTPNENMTSLADIQSDSRVSPTQEGAGTSDYLTRALKEAASDYNRISIAYTDQGGPFNEGRLDVGAIPIINGSIEASYVQEQKSTVDLRVLEWPDEAVTALEDDPLIRVNKLDMTQFEGYAHTPDEVVAPQLAFNWVVPNSLDYDVLYETLNILYENRTQLSEYHSLMGYLESPDYWVKGAYEDIPHHPAAADFFQEIGVWNDSLIRGQE